MLIIWILKYGLSVAFYTNFILGGGQTFEQPNVERPIFRNFEIPNIKKTKVELFDFLFSVLKKILRMFKLFEHSKYFYDNLPIYKIGNFWNFDRYRNYLVLKVY